MISQLLPDDERVPSNIYLTMAPTQWFQKWCDFPTANAIATITIACVTVNTMSMHSEFRGLKVDTAGRRVVAVALWTVASALALSKDV